MLLRFSLQLPISTPYRKNLSLVPPPDSRILASSRKPEKKKHSNDDNAFPPLFPIANATEHIQHQI